MPIDPDYAFGSVSAVYFSTSAREDRSMTLLVEKFAAFQTLDPPMFESPWV
ncbi:MULTISPECIES: hypothetical protein [Rhodococcus]|uniref:hypothetical protein n=1 Tax=Rhodococcus TaxID=1827 RepID=UPI0012E34783|nr:MULTISPECIES: hypothetical protein [Rhodococcus]MCZ4618716.1 hypothetical protein [Rhodococcus qingshengii]